MWIGGKREGPYKDIVSVLFTKPGCDHYAYLVKTDAGAQVGVDGVLTPHAYTALYRSYFNADDGELDLLALKDSKMYGVALPLRVEPTPQPTKH